MITRRIRIQVILFVVIALLGISYVGVRYVGLERLVGGQGYQAKLELPDAGGIFDNAEVTYRGVPVGRVGSLTLTDDGVVVTLDIESSAPKIPANTQAVITNRSAIGEQYVDLRPTSDAGPYLEEGSVIKGSEASLPPKVENLLRDTRDFAASVPIDALRTVVDELYLATRGAADPLSKLLATSASLAQTADASFPATKDLIENSSTVLATQEASAESIRSFSANLRLFAGTLRSSDRDFRQLLAVAPDASEQVQALFVQVGKPLGVVLGNLISTAQVLGTNSAGIRDIMIRVPQVIDVGYDVAGPTGLKVGFVTNFFNPLPCTQGYGATPLRSGLDTSRGKPLSTKIGCTAKNGRTSVRGAQNAPAPAAPIDYSVQVTSPTELSDLMGGSSE